MNYFVFSSILKLILSHLFWHLLKIIFSLQSYWYTRGQHRCTMSRRDNRWGIFEKKFRESRNFRALAFSPPHLVAVLPLLDYPVIFSPFSRKIIRLSVHCGFLLSFMSSARFPCMLNILSRYFHRSFQLCHSRTRHFVQPHRNGGHIIYGK